MPLLRTRKGGKMSKFKDLIKKDISTIFFNADEFSEIHILTDAKTTSPKRYKVRAIIDKLELIERQKGAQSNYTDGLYTNQLLIYVPIEDLPTRPAVGKMIYLDGQKVVYIVKDITEEDGVYSITIEATRT